MVEPILVVELPFTLILAALFLKRSIHRRDWLAAAAMTGGLILLIASLGPKGGSAQDVSNVEWGIGIAVTLALVAVMVWQGRSRQGAQRAALFGVSTGISFGLTAALITATSEAFSRGLLGTFTTWQT